MIFICQLFCRSHHLNFLLFRFFCFDSLFHFHLHIHFYNHHIHIHFYNHCIHFHILHLYFFLFYVLLFRFLLSYFLLSHFHFHFLDFLSLIFCQLKLYLINRINVLILYVQGYAFYTLLFLHFLFLLMRLNFFGIYCIIFNFINQVSNFNILKFVYLIFMIKFVAVNNS